MKTQDATGGDAAASPTRHRAKKVGVVVSDGMNKTATVAVHRMIPHGEYKRIIRRTSKFFAHDEKNEARVGDQVEIVETRPMSKNKRWRISRIIARAGQEASE